MSFTGSLIVTFGYSASACVRVRSTAAGEAPSRIDTRTTPSSREVTFFSKSAMGIR